MVTKVDNDQLNVKVYIGYNDSILKNTHLTVYLIEDSVVSQNQSNAPLGYIHNHVVRDVLTSYNGDSVSLKGGNLLVGVDYKENEVLNCQISTLGETKKWD
jgi:hypothetical protein